METIILVVSRFWMWRSHIVIQCILEAGIWRSEKYFRLEIKICSPEIRHPVQWNQKGNTIIYSTLYHLYFLGKSFVLSGKKLIFRPEVFSYLQVLGSIAIDRSEADGDQILATPQHNSFRVFGVWIPWILCSWKWIRNENSVVEI